MIRRIAILTLIGSAILIGGIVFIEFSGVFDRAPISGHGWFAFALGGVFSILVSVGLFALVFFSARSGHDERANTDH